MLQSSQTPAGEWRPLDIGMSMQASAVNIARQGEFTVMDDSNSATLPARITAWRLRMIATLTGSRRRKVATAVALMLASLAVFDPTGFDGTQKTSSNSAQNLSEDEFEQIEAMLAELERSPDLSQSRTSADSATANIASPASQSPSGGALLIPVSTGHSESEQSTGVYQESVAASHASNFASGDAVPAGLQPRVPAAARGISYSGSEQDSPAARSLRIRLTGTIDPL
jgi:hypothetical protein